MPLRADTLVDVLEAWRDRDRIAYRFLQTGEVDGPIEEISYPELWRRSCAGAALLREHGQPGSRVLLLYPSGLDFIVGFFSCLIAGFVAVPAYPPDPFRLERTLTRLRAIASDCDPAIVLTIDLVRDALSSELPGKCLTLEDGAGITPVSKSAARVDAMAMLQYTSGSTGRPKGVEVTHRALQANEHMIVTSIGLSSETDVLSWLPLYHDMGLIGMLFGPLSVGSTCTLMSPIHFLQRPLRWLRALSRYRATISGGPNFGYDLCARKVREEELAELRLDAWTRAFNGAEPIRAATLERFARTFAPCGFRAESFMPCYGLAESTLLVSMAPIELAPRVLQADVAAFQEGRIVLSEEGRAHVSCGPPAVGTEIAIVDPATLARCPADRIGEIWVKSAAVAAGYWKQPEASVETFRAEVDGYGPFLRTGDLGFLHEGELFVTGRSKDLIVISGRNIAPQDLELTVERSHPSVRPGCCAAFAIERDDTEQVVLVAEITANAVADTKEIVTAARMAVFKEHQLSVFDVALLPQGSLEKTTSGKVSRSASRRGYLDGTLPRLPQ